MEAEGELGVGVFRLTSAPTRFLFVEEWQTRGAMDAAGAKHGGAFNREAGTEDVQWDEKVWTRVV